MMHLHEALHLLHVCHPVKLSVCMSTILIYLHGPACSWANYQQSMLAGKAMHSWMRR